MKKDTYGKVWLRGSQKYLHDRVIYTDGKGNYFCKFYGKYIEVRWGSWCWYTAKKY